MKAGLTWREQLGLPECPYAERWVFNAGLFTLRVHHFVRSDDDRAFHDHPWWFLTLVVKGSYIDRSPNGDDVLKPGSVRFRPARHRHTVVTYGVWTIVLTGRKKRAWGFWQGDRFRKANKWFFEKGHHPCD